MTVTPYADVLEPLANAVPPPRPTQRDTPDWLVEARKIVADLYDRRPLIYWTDFLVSITLAWSATALYFTASPWSAGQIGAFFAAGLLFFRSGLFMHELVHARPGELVWFGRVWNTLLGVPLLMPWVIYRNHVDHHSALHYGTPRDGEYLPLASSPVKEIVKYLVQAPLLPLYMVARFGIIGPVSRVHPRLREFVLTAMSAAASNPYYRKRFPKREGRHLNWVEWLCFSVVCGIVLAVRQGWITGTQLLMAYALMTWALSLNWLRNLVAHRYSNRGEPIPHVEQFYESINITGQAWLTVLLFPIGMRYHATHHLFPSMPYHHLAEAHRRLSSRLPPDSPYHGAGRESFWVAAVALWNSAKHIKAQDSAMSVWTAFKPAGRPIGTD